MRWAVLAAAWLVLGAAVATWGGLAFAVDRHWLGTVVGLSPRWLLAVPVAALLPAAAIYSRGATLCLLASGLVVLGPVMDFRIPWARLLPQRPAESQLCVMGCNVGGLADVDALARVVERERVVFAACQEWPGDLPWPAVPGQWHVARDGSLLVAGRYPLSNVEALVSPREPWRRLAVACDLQTDDGTLRCAGVHLPTPRSGLEAVRYWSPDAPRQLNAVNQLRSEESRLVRQWIGEQRADIVLGDFNMVRESQIYRRDWSDFENAFSRAGFGLGHTKFTRGGISARIDHVLCRRGWTARRAWVGPDVGSDHRPVLAELRRPAASSTR